MCHKSILRFAATLSSCTLLQIKISLDEAWERELQEDGDNFVMRNFLFVFYTTYIIWVIKSTRIKWAAQVERVGDMRNQYKDLSENLKGRNNL
jgi:hypothetical protein